MGQDCLWVRFSGFCPKFCIFAENTPKRTKFVPKIGTILMILFFDNFMENMGKYGKFVPFLSNLSRFCQICPIFVKFVLFRPNFSIFFTLLREGRGEERRGGGGFQLGGV